MAGSSPLCAEARRPGGRGCAWSAMAGPTVRWSGWTWTYG